MRNLQLLENAYSLGVGICLCGAHNPPTVLIQWDLFQQEGGHSDPGRKSAGGKETIELAFSGNSVFYCDHLITGRLRRANIY